MRRKSITSVLLPAIAVAIVLPTVALAQKCDWFNIAGCFSSWTGNTNTATTTNVAATTATGSVGTTGGSVQTPGPIILASEVFSLTATTATIKVSTDVPTTVTVTFSYTRDNNQTATGSTASVSPFDAFISLGILQPETNYDYTVTVTAANGVSTASGFLSFTTPSLRDAPRQADPSRFPPPPPAPTPEQLFTLAVDSLSTIPSPLDRLLCRSERITLEQGGLLPSGDSAVPIVRFRTSGPDSAKKIIFYLSLHGIDDADEDGLIESDEDAIGTNDANADTDGDGKDDCTERWVPPTTNPLVRD